MQGNLLAVGLPTGTLVQYEVDGRNRRLRRLVNGVATHGFLYQGQLHPIAELDGAGTLVSRFVRFVYGARAVAPEYLIRAGVSYRLVTDHLGSVRLVVNTTSGAITQRLDYDAFGQVTLDTNPGFQPFGYAGGLYDPLTGLVRFGARDYHPAIGRWLAKDPIGFDGDDANLYAYVFGDPNNLVDPTGEFARIVAGGVIGAAVNVGFAYLANDGNAQPSNSSRRASVGSHQERLEPPPVPSEERLHLGWLGKEHQTASWLLVPPVCYRLAPEPWASRWPMWLIRVAPAAF